MLRTYRARPAMGRRIIIIIMILIRILIIFIITMVIRQAIAARAW